MNKKLIFQYRLNFGFSEDRQLDSPDGIPVSYYRFFFFLHDV